MPASDVIVPLSIASVLLGCVGILIAISGVFAFLNIRSQAKREARDVATEIARDLSERAAIDYLRRELPSIVHEYRELGSNAAVEGQANKIADRESEDDR